MTPIPADRLFSEAARRMPVAAAVAVYPVWPLMLSAAVLMIGGVV